MRRPGRRYVATFVASSAAVVALASACGETKAPPSTFVPSDAGVTMPTTDASPTISDGSVPSDAAVIRTRATRSPMGRMDVPRNLFLDGDFEFTGASDLMPWILVADDRLGPLPFSTGGACPSGIRCGRVGAGQELYGAVASPKSDAFRVSVWVGLPDVRSASPDAGPSRALTCADVTVNLVDLGQGNGDPETSLQAFEGRALEGENACRFEGLAAPSFARFLYVAVAAKPDTLGPGRFLRVDDAVALPTTDPFPSALGPATSAARRVPVLPGSREDVALRRASALVAGLRGNAASGRRSPGVAFPRSRP
ncbi:MAG: hypothetical protein U0169_26685 [Polyangiaceae bacterium]